MKSIISLIALFGLMTAYEPQDTRLYPEKSHSQKQNKVQVALLLDTSSSMRGLIEQAKAKLWKIVNEIAERGGEDVVLELALYEYGNSGLSSNDGFVRQLSSFTHDVDQISENLFSLTTNGGKEYCGEVLSKSFKELKWDNRAMYKVVFIAGNESFAQGTVDYIDVMETAQGKDILVNTIFCGDFQSGISLQWKDGALRGGGDFFVINHNEQIQYINTPYDDQLNALNKKLNETYIPYGKDGKLGYENLHKQDNNAAGYGTANIATRSLYKIRGQYNNANWDLIDAYNTDKKVIRDIHNLPESYSKLTELEIQQKIEQLILERNAIKGQMKEVGRLRNEYIHGMKNKDSRANGLEDSLIKSIKKQMKIARTEPVVRQIKPARIDYIGFSEATAEVQAHRQKRLIDLNTFLSYAKDTHTLILDTRSKQMYEAKHLANAVHLNFSDFSEEKLAKLIPNKDTRILIYCNNNLLGDPILYVGKMAPMALNIPTYINLYAYGYKNVYELSEDVHVSDERLKFEGLAVRR